MKTYILPNYTLSISHSPRALAIGGQWNVKIIESPLRYTLISAEYMFSYIGRYKNFTYIGPI